MVKNIMYYLDNNQQKQWRGIIGINRSQRVAVWCEAMEGRYWTHLGAAIWKYYYIWVGVAGSQPLYWTEYKAEMSVFSECTIDSWIRVVTRETIVFRLLTDVLSWTEDFFIWQDILSRYTKKCLVIKIHAFKKRENCKCFLLNLRIVLIFWRY